MKKLFVIFLFCLSLTAAAQNQIKRVAILETVDREGAISYMKLLQFRSNLTTAITNTEGYEGYDRADLKQIIGEQNFQRTGLVSDADIKKIGQFTGAQYVLIAEAAVDGNSMFITAKIIDVETARVLRNSNQLMGTSAAEMQEGSQKVAAELLGVSMINNKPQMVQSNSRTEDFVISKKLLQERGFRFPNAQREGIATLKSSKGDINIICSTYDVSAFNNAWCYGVTRSDDCSINGLVLIKSSKSEDQILCYIACGCMVYPYMKFRIDKDHYFVGIDEEGCSYGCAYYPNWSLPDRDMCACMKKLFGNNVLTIGFIKEVVNNQIYLPELQQAFEDFLKNGGYLDCEWAKDSLKK